MSAVVALICAVALIAGVAFGLGGATADNETPPLRMSEIMTSNGSTVILADGALPDWIEIENTSSRAVDLTGWALVNQAKPSNAFAFPGGMLNAGERLVVYCDNSGKSIVDGQYHAPFRMSASGATVALLNKRGETADLVTTPALARDQVYCRDSQGAWQTSDAATPGTVNRVETFAADDSDGSAVKVVPGPVVISEVMSKNVTFFPDENGEHPDYVEVHNTTGQNVNLAGWALSNKRSKLMRWQFPSINLPAGGYLAVHCSGVENKGNDEHLHADFRISREGEDLYLTDPDGRTTTFVHVPVLEADEAYSLIDTAWSRSQSPTPGYANDETGTDSAADSIRQANTKGVYITEVLASSNKSDDWIEIYNPSAQAVDLSGCGLSDNASRPRKWQFPQGTVIQPGAYLGVFCNGQDASAGGKFSTNYLLSSDGGYSVTLSEPDGTIFDRLFVPLQYQNISFGRPDTLSGVRYFVNPTPGAANAGEMYYGRAPQPVYSVYGGLYHTGDVLQVEMSVPSGCQIYYTLDCKDPTQASTLYTGPITVTGTTVLRTRVYGEGYLESVMDAQSYLFDVNNADGTVFVMSLVSDPYNLTSDEAGIMVKGPNAYPSYPYGSMNKGANFWMDWEREAHIEVFNPDGSTMISQECGTKLHGQYSRAELQKAFKIIARSQYGSNRFHAAIFSRRPYTEYQSFLLRSSSEDGMKTRMRDALMQRLAEGHHVMYQETEIGVLYIDGQYWGHYNLRERINTASICQFEGWEGEEDDLDLIKANVNVMQGSNETMTKLLDWVKSTKDMNTDEAYEVLDQAIDITNYVEYMVYEMYTGNTDTLNVKRYRNPKRDGKWRWVLFDLDWGFHEDTNSVRRWLEPGGMGNKRRTDNTLFIACMKNERFRDQFLTFLGEQMATTFTYDNIMDMINNDFMVKLKPLLPDQFARWGQTEGEYKEAMKKFVNYIKSRPGRMLQFLKGAQNLHLTKAEMEHYFGDVMEQQGVTYESIQAA